MALLKEYKMWLYTQAFSAFRNRINDADELRDFVMKCWNEESFKKITEGITQRTVIDCAIESFGYDLSNFQGEYRPVDLLFRLRLWNEDWAALWEEILPAGYVFDPPVGWSDLHQDFMDTDLKAIASYEEFKNLYKQQKCYEWLSTLEEKQQEHWIKETWNLEVEDYEVSCP